MKSIIVHFLSLETKSKFYHFKISLKFSMTLNSRKNLRTSSESFEMVKIRFLHFSLQFSLNDEMLGIEIQIFLLHSSIP